MRARGFGQLQGNRREKALVNIRKATPSGWRWKPRRHPRIGAAPAPSTMASGITVTSHPDSALLERLGVSSWPTWGCEASTFPWTYDEQETCLLLEGDVTVTPDGGEPVRFGAGDLVVFAAGLSCTWQVHAPVRKHYRFG